MEANEEKFKEIGIVKTMWNWLIKVFWPVLEPIVRWGLRLVLISGLIWFLFYSEIGVPVKNLAASAVSTVYEDFVENMASSNEAAAPVKKATVDKRLEPCLKRASEKHTSCLMRTWGKSNEQNTCETLRLQQVDRCEDRYGR